MRLFWLVVFVLTMLGEVMGQGRADRLYERGDYLGALKLYRKDLESAGEGENSEKLKARVANCFFRLNDVVRAGQMYKTLDQDKLDAEDLLFYATTLQRSGEYDKALGVLDIYESMGGNEAVVEQLKASCDFAKAVMKEKPIYSATKTSIEFSGFSAGVTYYKGKGIILAAPGTGENSAQDSRGYKTTRLYNAVFTGDGKGGRLLPFAEELVEKYHIGAVTFTKDFNRIYYTKTILKKDGSSILKLLTAACDNGKWEKPEELNINSDDYSCAHPALYKDSLLFFVSDMPGGYGGKDVYMTVVDGANCSDVQNLGETVNTPDDELFPWIDEDGRLYFSSNGRVGLGGLDVYVSQMTASGWTEPQNMGRPINSSMDDFGLVFRDTKSTEGYVSSNRGGTGYNDFLFALKLLPKSKTVQQQQPETVPEKPVVVPEKDMYTVDYRYAIQIGAFRNPVPRVYFDKFQNVKVYLGFDNIYRYTVGEYPEEGVADRDVAEVRKMIGDAFVVSVDRYVMEQKIRSDVKGDKVSDDELLLIRLKNFEKEKKARMERPVASGRTKRYLAKPVDGEIRQMAEGYTVVLMPASRVLDVSRFAGIPEVDVYAVEGGEYMYCSGLFASAEEAADYLKYIRGKGFQGARVERTNAYPSSAGTRKSPGRQADREDLKALIGAGRL